jgi:hypothetical protein
LRIGLQNIGGLSGKNTEQDKLLQQFIQSNSFDVFGINEVNLYWPALQEELQFGERMNQRFNPRESRKNYAYKIMGPLNNNHLRIGFQNIGGLSSNNTEQDKLLQQFIQSNSFDIFGISEVNLYWPALREFLQFGEQMNRRFNPRESQKNYAYNIHQTTRPRNSVTQYGGTAMISQKNAAIRHYRSHKDPRGPGRWVEQTFKGKGTHFLTVICR